MAGAQGYEAMADYAAYLTQPQRRTLRCWKRRSGIYDAPCATTFWDLLNQIAFNELDGVVLTSDALNTQRESARHLVQDKGAHYVFTVKDDQPGRNIR